MPFNNQTLVLGVGAAGNKAALALYQNDVIQEHHIKLLNTTLKDIPDGYKNSSMILKFDSELGGCGKEPAKGRDAIIRAIKTDSINFSSMIGPEDKQVIIVTSTEGGTGCGATPIIAKYFDAMNMPVHVFAFIGFQDEARGLQNTLKFFKDLPNSVILHTIKNSMFMDYTSSYQRAEEAANEEFVQQVKILLGMNMIPSSQNIDDTDQYKISITPGYMDIKHCHLQGAKSSSAVNGNIAVEFDNSTALGYAKGCKRLAVIINASEAVRDAIDDNFAVIKRYIGEPYETYRHIQNDGSGDEYMDIIIAGLQLPEEDILQMSKKYAQLKNTINKSSKSFDDIFNDIDLDDDSEFDVSIKNRNIKKDTDLFFDIAMSGTKDKKQPEDGPMFVKDMDGIESY